MRVHYNKALSSLVDNGNGKGLLGTCDPIYLSWRPNRILVRLEGLRFPYECIVGGVAISAEIT